MGNVTLHELHFVLKFLLELKHTAEMFRCKTVSSESLNVSVPVPSMTSAPLVSASSQFTTK